MVNARSRFVWYELMTTNMEGAATFYSRVVGWQTSDRSQPGAPYALFTVGGVSVSGLMDLSVEAQEVGARPSWIGYIGTDNIDASADRIERLGGTVQVPPTEIPKVSRFSVVADPQGAPIGLLQWLLPAKAQGSLHSTMGGVRWHELLVPDVDAAFRFYGELFGWPKADSAAGDPGEYHLLSMGGETLGAIFGQRSFVGSSFVALLLYRRGSRPGFRARRGGRGTVWRARRKSLASAGLRTARTHRGSCSRWWESGAAIQVAAPGLSRPPGPANGLGCRSRGSCGSGNGAERACVRRVPGRPSVCQAAIRPWLISRCGLLIKVNTSRAM